MFNRVMSILLLMVFLFGTTGVTVLQHVCSGGNTREIKAIDGFSGAFAISCSCDEESPNEPAKSSDDLPGFSAPPCCYELTTLFKFDFVSHAPFYFSSLPLNQGFASLLPILSSLPIDRILISDDPYFRFHSPPLTGIHLLHAIHQIKIPAISSLT